MDIICRTNTGIKSSSTYDGLYSIDENGKFSLRIFSPLKPNPSASDNNLEFITGQVDPSILGVNSTSKHIIELWERYEAYGLPLEDIAQSLYTVEMTGFIKSGIRPSFTLLAEIIVLLDSIDKCNHITGFNERLSKDKRKLLDIIESRNKDQKNLQKNTKVCERICTMQNEYSTAVHINMIIPIELTNDVRKPDFKIKDNGISIDAKLRLVNDRPVYKDQKDIDLPNGTILSLLMKDGFAPLQTAFDEQNADIAMVNLSLTSYGFMLSTSLIPQSDFKPAMTTALEMVKSHEKAVIFYTLPRGTINGIRAVCFRRSIIDDIGGDLSRLDSQFYRLDNNMNFSEFAAYVNGLKSNPANTPDNGGLRIRGLNDTDISTSYE